MAGLSKEEKKKLSDEVIPIAERFRKTYIGDLPINDSFEMIQQLGYFIVKFPALDGNTDLSGFLIKKGQYNCIYINSRHSLGRQYTSIWHECYHAYTGDGCGLSYTKNLFVDPAEYKANAFAGGILMPENLIAKYIQENSVDLKCIDYVGLIKMQNYFNVSYSALLTRILQIYPQYRNDLQDKYAIGKNTPEAIKQFTEVTKLAEGKIELIQPTNDIYIPEELFDNIQFNLKENRISKEKALDILELIDGLEKNVD